MPWAAVAASSLLVRPPEHPGEVRFAKSFTWHNDNLMLVAPLTQAEAEDRHREYEEYFLGRAAPDGILAIIERDTGCRRLKPGECRFCDQHFSIVSDCVGTLAILLRTFSPGSEDKLFRFSDIHVHNHVDS